MADETATPAAVAPPPLGTSAAAPAGRPALSAREFFEQGVDGHTLSTVATQSGVARSILFRHAKQAQRISQKNAERLEAWSLARRPDGPFISAARTLGLSGR